MTKQTHHDRIDVGQADALTRRRCVMLLGSAVAAMVGVMRVSAAMATATTRGRRIVVYKSPTCGCCGAWVAYMRRHGFKVTVKHTEDIETAKRAFGVPEDLGACHTAIVGGYVVEGHVPAASVVKLLAERPKARGIAVPGMPMGTPGMGGDGAGPTGVLLFDANGVVKRYDTD